MEKTEKMGSHRLCLWEIDEKMRNLWLSWGNRISLEDWIGSLGITGWKSGSKEVSARESRWMKWIHHWKRAILSYQCSRDSHEYWRFLAGNWLPCISFSFDSIYGGLRDDCIAVSWLRWEVRGERREEDEGPIILFALDDSFKSFSSSAFVSGRIWVK